MKKEKDYECPNPECRKPTTDYGLYCPSCRKKGWGVYKNGEQIRIRE